MKICYTYWTNNGNNIDCGFDFPSFFFQTAEKSLKTAVNQPYQDDVVIYTDRIGLDVIRKNIQKIPRVSFVVVDYNQYNFDKRYWNFPKMVTYAMQDTEFIHIDFDVFLKQNFIEQIDYSASIFCEKMRDYKQEKEFARFNSNGKTPKKLICSGILGGSNVDAFKDNFKAAQLVCVPTKEDVTFESLVAIEEYSLTKLAAARGLTVQELCGNSFIHFQGKNKHLRFSEQIKNYKV
jgi:hypothetical protein